jgi:leucyl/phenylalanyl-tRNA--protein transferase
MSDLEKSLDSQTILMAYANGYFPMPHPETGAICWFNPDPRAILPLDGFHASRSLKRAIARHGFTYTINKRFNAVMEGCADRDDTWINQDIKMAYKRLFDEGFAHSLEVWHNDKLAGGLYGVALGGAFFAESKFHKVSNASKAALYFLTEHLKAAGFTLLEIQFLTPHLASLGAVEVSAEAYQDQLVAALKIPALFPYGKDMQKPVKSS